VPRSTVVDAVAVPAQAQDRPARTGEPKVSVPAASITWSRDFALFHARRSVADLKAALEQATEEFVVVVRDRDFYAYRRAELAMLLEGKSPDMTLEDALGLREIDRSQSLDLAASPPPLPAGSPQSAGRYVRVGASGLPVEVGEPTTGPDAGTLSIPTEGTGPRTRSGPTRGASRGGGLRDPRLRPGTKPSPPDVGGPDEGSDIVRHPSITPDKTPKSGKPFSVTVDLLRERSDLETVGDDVRVAKLPKDWGEIPIQVQLMSTALDCSPVRGIIFVRRNAPSIPCTFQCKPQKGVDVSEPVEVIATFSYEGRFCGLARRTIGAPGREAAAGAGVASAPTTRGNVLVDMGAEAPDLTVKIFHPEHTEVGCFAWSLTPRERFDGLPGKLDGSIQLESSAGDYARDLFGRLADLTPGDHMGEFEGIGETLWNRAPDCFRQAYWAIRDHSGKNFSIQFISDDPYIPWELMRPVRPGEAANLLIIDHPVARWIAHYDGDLRNRLPLGRIVTIAPKYRPPQDLPEAQGEAKRLEDGFGALRLGGTKGAVKRVLAEGIANEPVAVVHFAGHGQYGEKFADASHIFLEDGKLSVSEVGSANVKLGEKDRTLVIFNACEVGAVGGVLGMVGGWAEAFTRRRFGGFLAPLWPVADNDAVTVISEFLDAVWKQRKPVGDSLRAIREKYGARSPTFLSYLFYGDVAAKVVEAR
jgi:CHAT domain